MNPQHPQANSKPTGTELDRSLLELASRRTTRSPGRGRNFGADRLRVRLDRLYSDLERTQTRGRTASRAEEWLLDNRHVVDDALESLRQDMPAAYVRSLPHVPVDGQHPAPRIHELARILIAHAGGPLEPGWIEHIVDRLQVHAALSIGELWALPSFLTLEIILGLLADGRSVCEAHRDQEGHEESSLTDRIAGDVISLRALAAHDWRDSFERLSHVERILAEDPAGAYDGMDFHSRDRYRRVVERLAKRGSSSEKTVARTCIELCQGVRDTQSRHRHVGYWLIAGGLGRLERQVGFRPSGRERLRRLVLRWPGTAYFSTLMMFIVAPLALLTLYLLRHEITPAWTAVTLGLVVIPVTGLSVALVNGLVTWLVEPRTLARMELRQGIPREFRTAVVVPVIFSGTDDVDSVFERLESNYLANDEDNLVYVVLGDLHDSDCRDDPGDRRILKRARTRVHQLGARHETDRFLFLCRRRRLNENEGCWMGWERKRGKLMEFNRLLDGAEDTSFNQIVGDTSQLEGVRYVITLDADTRLQPGTARQLVGTLAHPLSRAVHGKRPGTLEAGFSIIQPRLEVDPDTTMRNGFTRVFSGDTTIDLYTHASSDVYHDLFGEGIFTGKGIYDWRALEFTVGNRIPENTLLSHDLLEGVHGRVGLASDIVLMEQFPSGVVAFMRRQHRWVRGDWQLLPWLRRRVRTAGGQVKRNTLKAIHRWKIIDNLRRSLQPPAVLLLIVMALAGVLPGKDWLWLLIFAAFLGAGLITEILDLFGRCLTGPATALTRLRHSPHALKHQLEYWLFNLVLLPYQSHVLLDAIGRSLVRMTLTHRHMLEWTTAAHMQRGPGLSRSRIWREMWAAPASGLALSTLVPVVNPTIVPVAAGLLLGWLLAPAVARQAERSRARKVPRLGSSAQELLRRTARRTWLFFDHFVGPDTHWLPPDNYQEDPRVVLAARTSPTNMGMALNAVLAAHDFGWVDKRSLLAWLRNSMEGMNRLEKYRGHWLNWYEIRDLERLEPAYISTVDSGNLAVSLITLSQALEEMERAPLDPAALVRGLGDTLSVIAETVEALPGVVPSHAASRDLLTRIVRMRTDLEQARTENCWHHLESWRERQLGELSESVIGLAEDNQVVVSAEAISELRIWLDELDRQIKHAQGAIRELQPWLADLPDLTGAAALESGVGNEWHKLVETLTGNWSLIGFRARIRRAQALIERIEAGRAGALLDRLGGQLEHALTAAAQLLRESSELRALAEAWVEQMDFSFLYDSYQNLFRVGYDLSNANLDPNHYDLLASEARLASLLAIGRGQVPLRHWIHLGRPFRRRQGRVILMSWGATLFEYLMPRLYTRTPENSLLDSASRTAIRMHREFADRHDIPWGIAESAYYQLDEQHHYAYRAFGVPGLGFKRDLGERLVVAPYASLMALPFDQASVVDNLRRIKLLRGIGLYGCYEAIDFGRRTKSQPRRGRIVKAWMSHHQGMALLAIDNCLNDDIMVRRFHRDPHIAGVSMLLHERLPRTTPGLEARMRLPSSRALTVAAEPQLWPVPARSPVARYTVLSNGHYSTLINSDGGGGSFWQGIGINRWQPDTTTNAWGQWIYIKNLDSGNLFTVTPDPCGERTAERLTTQGPHQAGFRCRHEQLVCRMRVAVAAQHDIEGRRVLISNQSNETRRLVISSFAELSMAPPREFERHPAFARLFVESDCLPEEQILVFRRRPRSSKEKPLYVAHMAIVADDSGIAFGYETDRGRFIGRNGSIVAPAGLSDGLDSLSGRTGAVVDPAMAAAVEIELGPYGRTEVVFLTGAGRSRRELLGALREYRSMGRIDWLFEQARMQTGQELHHLELAPGAVETAMKLMSAALTPHPAWRRTDLRPDGPIQALLWSRGISGDWPIIAVTVRASSGAKLVSDIIQAHTLMAGRQIRVDLVLIDEEAGGYEQTTRDRLHEISESIRARLNRVLTGPVIIVSGRDLSAEQRNGILAAASVVLEADGAGLAEQLQPEKHPVLPPLIPDRPGQEADSAAPSIERPRNLQFDNAIGGFSANGGEYVIHLEPGQTTPAPWSNVLANPDFGTLVTESGTSYTWAGNSSEYRLTPWPNDPVTDPSGEVIYLRDEETGRVWTPTPSPRPGQGAYQVRHGHGRTIFLHNGHGLIHRYSIHVDPEQPVKICTLELTNACNWTRRITVTSYLEWVLGNRRGETGIHIESDLAMESRALLARNTFDRFAGQAHAFVAASLPIHGFTTDRTEFLGQGGDIRWPHAMWRIGLSGILATGADCCAALQCHMDIPAGESRRVTFVIGHGRDREQALALADRFGDSDEAGRSRRRNRERWETLLGRVRVDTPDRSMNLLLNDWLPYQAISSRLWGRTGYYQSSGGIGFRDQLQDAMAMIWLDPSVTRRQILLAASRQFREGDVLHWWHESPLRGVRTRCSDDLLWLPYVTARYVRATGDTAILDQEIAYLAGEPLAAEEAEHYSEFEPLPSRASLYEHCCRAIDRGSTVGPHGLPIIGSGDWNDGFDRVSTSGRGESVWLAWFLIRVLTDFSACCDEHGDSDTAVQYRGLAERLAGHVEVSAWDGQWYRRAWFDDGTPLGSSESEECQIDLIAQAWSVMSGAGHGDRARQAMRSAIDLLVDLDDRLIVLLDPPFNTMARDPGYIKGYPPGIRENGAQYTHAATWAVWAAAELGWNREASDLFRLLDPIRRTAGHDDALHYRVEPYVLSGDIYSQGENRGRGGWSWYSGAAAWLYRAGIEVILGLDLQGDRLTIDPCLPPEWQRCSVRLTLDQAELDITITAESPVKTEDSRLEVFLDDDRQAANVIELTGLAGRHRVEVRLFRVG